MSDGKMTTATDPDLPANPFGAEKTCSACGFYTFLRMHPVKGLIGICRALPPQTSLQLVPVMRSKPGAILTAPGAQAEAESGLEVRLFSFWPDEILGGHWCGSWVPRPGSSGAMQ